MQPDASSIPSFREIHKNAWLKKVVFANNTKILSGNQKKSANERWWIVFCVHGDIEPYLEGYTDTATATAHVPRWKISLKHTLHVSGSVGPARPHTEYEFVITLQEGIVRLIAPTWEAMQDWVDTLRNKLREMKIISPKENVYSKGPEQSKPRAPTRDPTSPLPPPPPGPVIRVPGTEPSIRPVADGPLDDEVPSSSVSTDRTNNSGDAPLNGNDSSESIVESHSTAFNPAEFSTTLFDFDNLNLNRQPSVSNIISGNISGDDEIGDPHGEIQLASQNLNNTSEIFDFDVSNESHSKSETSATLLLDDYFRQDLTKVNIAKNVKPSTSKGSEFLSNIANVSGMNICLGDSVLEEMMKNDNNSLFSNFDSPENSLHNQSEINHNNSEHKEKIIIDKYTKVDLSKKTSKGSKGSKTFISVEPNDVPSISGQSSKIKPTVVPRKTILTEKPYVNSNIRKLTDDNLQSNIDVESERNKKCENHISSTEVQHSSRNLSINHEDESISNVTIIQVPNNVTVNLPSARLESQPPKVTPSEKNNITVEKSDSGMYANLLKNDFKSNTKVTLTLDNKDSNSSTSGYGHIRHTTTVGVSPNEIAYENTKCTVVNLNPSTSNSSNEIRLSHKMNHEKHKIAPKIRNINNVEINISNDGGLSIQNGGPSTSVNLIKNIKNTTKSSTSSETKKTNSGEEFYDSVFTPFSIPSVSSNVSENITSTSIPISSENKANKPVSSVFYVEHPNPTTTNNADKGGTEYEFLFWNESNNPIAESVLNAPTEPPENENKVESKDNELSPNANANNENSPQVASKSVASAKSQKHGLFTRGLTEFSLISKFRHPENQTSPKLPLLQNSQFYSYEEIECLQGNSSANTKPVEDHSKKSGAFTSKLNNIFHLGDDKTNANRTKPTNVANPVDRIRTESSLRRNWSERNDRIVLPIVKTNSSHNTQNVHNTPTDNSSRNPAGGTPSNEDQPSRRRSNSLSERRSCNESNPHRVDNTPVTTNNQETGSEPILLRPMSLREQQVARLRGEMAHSGGVRLRLRSGDSPGDAMAMADIYGTVWICGWKQKTHPLLYNALHIGDRLATIGGVPITSVRQAKRALKETSSGQHYVELVIKRLPHGRVYVINRDFDTQDLGFILDSATIVGVIPNSLAAKTGIPGSGTLTEINGRPLNLISKKGDTQVRDRLNAIGKDVSILIQPTEFVALLKSALRNMRGHKDYIVQ